MSDILPARPIVSLDAARVASHVLRRPDLADVISSRGLEEGARRIPRKHPPGVILGFDTDAFLAAVDKALAPNTAGYALQLRQHGQPIGFASSGWAKQPSDGAEGWDLPVRMHVASCSKFITAIAMTRALATHNLPPSTKIIDFLPGYWAKGPNIDKISFAQLMTHRSGFRVAGSDMSFPTMKALIAGGVLATDIDQYSYQNTNFAICRILLPVMENAIAKNATFPPAVEDQTWDLATVDAYAAYVSAHVFNPAGVAGPTLTHPDPDALAYTFPPASPWNSGDLTTELGGAGWHMSVDDLVAVAGAFRRAGTIMPPAAAQAMLDAGFGIDVIELTALGTLYNKNGRWGTGSGQSEQALIYVLPRDMELAVLTNSKVGVNDQFFRDLITNAYEDSIVPEFPVGFWIARHGLTAAHYQAAFNDYVGNHGMQLAVVSGYGGASARYAALWVKPQTAPAWEARHGLTAAQYQTIFNQLVAQGFQPVLVNGYASPAGARFACIFQKGITEAFEARHGLTPAQYQTTFDQLVGQGFVLDWVSAYDDSGQVRFAAIWRKHAGAPAWQARHGLTAAQYQAFFDQVVSQGFKPAVVCAYPESGQDHYACIFRKPVSAPAWQARHGLSAAQYQSTFDTLVGQGFRLELVNAVTVGSDDKFAAIWTK